MGPDAPHPPRAAAAGMQRRVAGFHSPAVWIGALAAVIVAVAILVWLLVRDGDDGTTHKARPTRAPAHAASIKRPSSDTAPFPSADASRIASMMRRVRSTSRGAGV